MSSARSVGVHWPRLAAEFVVIFLSVVLALVADDWREHRADREAERAQLTLILDEIRADGINLLAYAEQLREREREAVRFVQLVQRDDASPDTLWALSQSLTRNYNHRPERGAFDGLVDSGRLELIQDAEVRQAILSYYNFGVRYRMDLKARIEAESVRFDELARLHITERPDDEGEWIPHVTSTLAEIRNDEALLAAVAAGAADRRWLLTRIERVFMPLHDEVVTVLEGWLDR